MGIYAELVPHPPLDAGTWIWIVMVYIYMFGTYTSIFRLLHI